MAQYKSEYSYFNTVLTIIFESENFEIVKSINEIIIKKVDHLHKVFNYFDQESELSKLNNNKELLITNDNYDLLNIIDAAKKFKVLGNSYFNIDTTFDYEDLINIKDNIITTKNPLDLGAIAKGYFLDWCSHLLKNYDEDIFINFGGSILSYHDNLKVGLRSPKDLNNYAITMIINKYQTLHTSATYEQKYQNNQSHIYQKDLEDKYLANDLKSVTVIDTNSTACDALSTAIFAMDIDLAIAFCKDTGYNVIIIDNNMIYIKEQMMKNIIINSFDYEIVIY